ncbi:MAG: stage II sporulation protein R [Clostridia bacterium]
MKRIIIALCLIVCAIGLFALLPKTEKQEYLRIHIRANSNLKIDQDIKYKIKDAVVSCLTPIVSNCESLEQSKAEIKQNLNLIQAVVNSELKKHGFKYFSKAKLNNEQFPTRNYGDLTLEQGFYDALIVELGDAKGDNWWCVVYPPLCFLEQTNIVYKSRIVEIIKKVMGE